MGATRVCEFYNGKGHVEEEVIPWVENEEVTLRITEGTMPLKTADATMRVEPDSDGTRVSIDMVFKAKGGPLGAIMARIMMVPMTKKMLSGVLDGLDIHVKMRATMGCKGRLAQGFAAVEHDGDHRGS